MGRLKAANIGTGLHFVPLHRQTAFRRFAGPIPNTDAVGDRIVSLPLYPDMTDGDIDDVVAAVREALA
jgi:dTDP-4-amino-4,6-dideoxygalactose transaminase